MSKCMKCYEESFGRRVCLTCLKAYINRRDISFKQAVSEIGPLTRDTLLSIQQRVKEIERQQQRKEEGT